jgi:DsbC/DsbD-like thiol-disulfide interchange protein
MIGMQRTTLLIIACIVLAAGLAPAAEHVKPALVADVARAAPGQTFHVGVRFDIADHWHIYWINPGDSGFATTVKFTATGASVGDLQWPTPIRFMQPGDLVGYGYERQVVLMAPVQVPATAKAGETVTITAAARWLCCKDVCIPGDAKLTLSVPVAQQAERANAELFSQWRGKLPTEMNDPKSPVERIDVKAAGDRRILTITHPTPLRQVAWYPATGDEMELGGIVVKPAADRTVISFEPRVYRPQKLGRVIRTLLVYEDADGQRRGAWVDLNSVDVVPEQSAQ